MSISMLFVGGSTMGLLSYLPLYLRDSGWTPASADGALATFHAVSMIAAIPIATLSDRLGFRKRFMVWAVFSLGLGLVVLATGNLSLVWPAVVIAGITRDAFMAILMTMIVELKGIGSSYAGTAMGLAITFSRLGSFLAPPAGNSLAGFGLNYPFALWAIMAALGMIGFTLIRERRPDPTTAQAI